MKKRIDIPRKIEKEVEIAGDGVSLPGMLWVPAHAKGIVIFAHGSGSSRTSPRNQQVARSLNQRGLGTLLFDLLTPDESSFRKNVFDIALLASRLVLATQWLNSHPQVAGLPVGFFGASTGGGAALWAASELQGEVSAIVSRGGRPDLAVSRLPRVNVPTLLIVGGRDEPVLTMNREAGEALKRSSLFIVPGATHLFEEAGALDEVSRHASDWFERHFQPETKGVKGTKGAKDEAA